MQSFCSMFSGISFQFFPACIFFFIFIKINIIKQCLDIESGSTGNDRNMPAFPDFPHRFFGKLLKFYNMKFIIRLQYINQVMRYAFHLFWFYLRRADIHMPVNLHRVSGNNLAVNCFCKSDGGLCLANGRRTGKNDQWFFLHYTILLNFFSNSRLDMEIIVGLPCGQ